MNGHETMAAAKHAIVLIIALLLTPLAALHAKDEVGSAAKSAKRAFENAPPEKQALWQQHQEALKMLDISGETQRQVIIAHGTPEPGSYHAHPTTAMLADNQTCFASGTSATAVMQGRWRTSTTPV
jgi:hypothetical protein